MSSSWCGFIISYVLLMLKVNVFKGNFHAFWIDIAKYESTKIGHNQKVYRTLVFIQKNYFEIRICQISNSSFYVIFQKINMFGKGQ